MRSFAFAVSLFSLILFSLAPAFAGTDATTETRPVMNFTMEKAVEMALARNFVIRVETLSPAIAQQQVRQQLGRFDPVLGATYTRSETTTRPPEGRRFLQGDTLGAGIEGLTPWGLRYDLGIDSLANRGTGGGFEDRSEATPSIGFTQPLLRDFGTTANLYQVRLARRDAAISEWELRQQIIEIVTQIHYAYNEIYYQESALRTARQSESLAQRLLKENQARVEIGTMTPLEVTSARAQAAQRRESTIFALGGLRDAEVDLLKLVTDRLETMLGTEVEIAPPPSPAVSVESLAAIQDAFRWRPDYRQALLNLEKQKITVAYQRNQTLPRLDLVASLDLIGVDGSFSRSLANAFGGDGTTWDVGAIFSLPIPNRTARGALSAAKLTAAQQLINLKRLEQDIIANVDKAVRSINTARARIEATRESSVLALENLDAGEQKLRTGTSTTFEVLELQDDLRTAQLAEARARADYNEAIAELDRQTGTTIERNNIILQPPSQPDPPPPGMPARYPDVPSAAAPAAAATPAMNRAEENSAAPPSRSRRQAPPAQTRPPARAGDQVRPVFADDGRLNARSLAR